MPACSSCADSLPKVKFVFMTGCCCTLAGDTTKRPWNNSKMRGVKWLHLHKISRLFEANLIYTLMWGNIKWTVCQHSLKRTSVRAKWTPETPLVSTTGWEYVSGRKMFLHVVYSLNAIHSIALKVILMILFATVVVLVEMLTHYPLTNPLQLEWFLKIYLKVMDGPLNQIFGF